VILCKLISILDGVAVRLQTVSIDLMRIVSGLMMVVGHGYPKTWGEKVQPFFGGKDFFGIDVGINMLWIAGFIEFYVGILVILGLFTRPAALLTAILMVMAYLSSHAAWFPTLNGGEMATVYFLVFMVLFAYGPGPLSLDALLFKKRK
jgi:putative oxidoreductase